ncbi:hypothetical protein, partial [Klebsiella pneumoniae]|uniref:hypothetical protein n=1 Tax=Klebsiella pneumoniae TaxID=573 RepID=UPI0024DE0C74
CYIPNTDPKKSKLKTEKKEAASHGTSCKHTFKSIKHLTKEKTQMKTIDFPGIMRHIILLD